MAAPSAQLVRFSQRLLSQPDQRDAFLAALTQPQPDAPTILWTRPVPPVQFWNGHRYRPFPGSRISSIACP
jgi:hypothetical protein